MSSTSDKMAKESSGYLSQYRLPHLFVLFCLVTVLFKLTLLVIKRRKTIQQMEIFEGPPGHWFYGHLSELKQDGTSLDKILEWSARYLYAFPMWVGPFLCLLNITHPDYAKTILASTEPKGDLGYRFIQPWIGEGLLVSHGQKWFRNRRLLTPGFHYDVLKAYVKLMSDSANTMLDKWEKYARAGKTIEVFEDISLMTLDTLLKCAFSCKSNCQTEGGTNPYIQAVYELRDLINLRTRFPPYQNDWIFQLSPHGFKFRKACRVAHSHTDEVIRKRKEALPKEKELHGTPVKRNLDFLDILLSARDENNQGLPDEAIRAEVETFMFAGHDTTGRGISFILYCLACHPEHQQMCREEISQVLGGKNTMEWENLTKIPYTTMCIKESLRLFPPAAVIARLTTKPLTFFDGRAVPAGTDVLVNLYAVHRNASVWENPNVFDPLRFLPENVSSRSPHAFVPFSAGPRNCIGQTFAMNEIKAAVALTLQRYQLKVEPQWKPKLTNQLGLHSLNGIQIQIEPVEPNA